MKSKYKEIIPKVLNKEKMMSTNHVKELVANEEKVKYVDFNLIYRLLLELKKEGKVEMFEDIKGSCFWKLK